MAVQAPYRSDAFSPDFLGRDQNKNIFGDMQMLQDRDPMIGNLIGGQGILNNATVCSEPHSELTSNASGSRKRNRDYPSSMPGPLFLPTAPFRYPFLVTLPAKAAATDAVVVPAGLRQMSHEQSRMYGSAGTSTSGRTVAVSASSPVVSPLAQDLVSPLYRESVEIDALVRLQTETLRSGLEEARKRHCRALLSVVEQQAVKRLREKDAELECANRRKAELEEKVRLLSSENQIWFKIAKNNESAVSSLRTTLEQALLQNTVSALPEAKEGYGDSDDILFPADATQSRIFEEAEEGKEVAVSKGAENEELRSRKSWCRVCRQKELCVLLLPCRHLCLCSDCEPKLNTCPICHTTKNASLHIFMS